MSWFTKKTYPEFWSRYLDHFKKPQEQDLKKLRIVVFDTETTGLDIKKDRILSIGCIGISEMKIKVSDQLECYVEQAYFDYKSVKIHGLLKEGHHTKLTEKEAIIKFLYYIKDAVLVAHHAAFDIAIINQSLKRLKLSKLKNKVVDTGRLYLKTAKDQTSTHHSLDALANQLQIPLHDRHTASGDAYITALLFLKLIKRLPKQHHHTLKEVSKNPLKIGLL